MKRTAALILLIINLAIIAKAQEQPNKVKIADDLFERYEYFKSLSIYLKLADRNNPKTHVVERVADCYRLINDHEKAETWYKKVVDMDEAATIDRYYYAESLLNNKKTAEAREQYKIYYQTENTELLPFKLATCDSAEKWMRSPTTAFTVKNEQKFNTKYSDWGLTHNDSTGFIFVSNRKLSQKKKQIDNRDGEGYFKLFHTVKDTAEVLELNTRGNPIFNGDYHLGPAIFTNSGDTAYITVTTTLPKSDISVDLKPKGSIQKLYTRRLQLIIATKVKGKWANFKSFQYNNIRSFSVGHAALSKNGSVLYFASDMPGGEGNTDIWYCEKQSDGTWNAPVNCGKVINSKGDENFPNLSGDNTLYYSSTGLPGMGGMDIFKAKGEKATWSQPANLKFPVNSTSDDLCFTTRDSLIGYFSSNRDGGKGSDDIYSFDYKPPLVIASIPVKIAKPVITPKPTAPSPLLTMKKGDSFVLNNIYFNLNKSDIRPDAAIELDKLADVLQDRPSMRIEISAHTDSRAPSAYNMELSKRRAAATVAYLITYGIAPNRLVARGYGDTRLLNNCGKGEHCTEAEHQLNRRVEVRVLSE
jgi:OOP family OmpA-OmpF porin